MPGNGPSSVPWTIANRLPSRGERSSSSGSHGASARTAHTEGSTPSLTDTEPPIEGKRLAIVHGTLDGPLPGIPGVTAKSSRHAYERAVSQGIDASYTLVRGGLHGTAVRSPWGRTVSLPRARAWLDAAGAELARFEEDGR